MHSWEKGKKGVQLDLEDDRGKEQETPIMGVRLGLLRRTGIAMTKWSKMAKKSRDRLYRLKQLVNTEDDYLKVLIVLRDHVRLPLLQAHLLTEQQASRVFSNLQIMIELSSKLRDQLIAFEKSWDRHRSMLGLVIKTYVRFFLVYKDYFRNMNSAQARIKRLLEQEPRAREIEQSLAQWGKATSFEDLLSRPFQRPLKYHLIIRDYDKKVYQGHPDKVALADTLKAFQSVNEDNNEALNKRDKGERLQDLDRIFKDIMIEGEASRTYQAEFQAILFDEMVDLYLFSDLLLISFQKTESSRPEIRIKLDRWSSLRELADGHFFSNQLIIYGRDKCLHISFLQAATYHECSQILRNIIRNIQVNEKNRQQGFRGSNRDTIGLKAEPEFAFSMSYLPPQVTRPLVAQIKGWDNRSYFEDRGEELIVVEVSAARSLSTELVPKETILLPETDLFRIEKLAKQLYPQLNWLSLDSLPKGILKSKAEKDPQLRRQARGILGEVMLNTLFRSSLVNQRLDIFAHLMGVSQLIWAFLLPHPPCLVCSHPPPVSSPRTYHKQQRFRFLRKQELSQKRIFKAQGFTHFCERRTVEEALTLGRINLSAVQGENLQGRIQWLKCRKGLGNHALSHPLPSSTRLSVRVKLCGLQDEGVDVQVRLGERVGNVVERLEGRLGAMLQDCMMVARIGENSYLLSHDESINSILFRSPEPGLFGFSFFQKEPLKVSLFLRKVIFLEPQVQSDCSERELQMKLEELIWRLRWSEVRLNQDECAKVLGWYYCYKHFIELDTLSYYQVRKRAEELDRLIPERFRKQLPDLLFAQIEKVKCDKALSNQNQLAIKALRTLISASTGSCYFMEAQLRPDGIRVQLGANWERLLVRDRNSILFNFPYLEGLKVTLLGWELKVWADKPYTFFSREMWKLKELLDLMQDYFWQFHGKESQGDT